jgi:hypothetical protein
LEVTPTNYVNAASYPFDCGWIDGSQFLAFGCAGQIANANGDDITFIINAKPKAFGTVTDTLRIIYCNGLLQLDIFVSAKVPEL